MSTQLVDAHHGTVAVSSVVGKGSRFSVTLPIVQPEWDRGQSGRGVKPKHTNSGSERGSARRAPLETMAEAPERSAGASEAGGRAFLPPAGNSASARQGGVAFPLASSTGHLRGALVLCVDSDDADQARAGRIPCPLLQPFFHIG